MAYFSYFPTISYDVRGKKNNIRLDVITNVLVRNRKKLDVTDRAVFEMYFIQDGDRPDTLAHQVYGDSTLHWIIMYANYITDPYYDWPLTYFDLQKYIVKKYADINAVHHYEVVDNAGTKNEVRYEVEAAGTVIDSSGTQAGSSTAISNFLYEERKNDAKRNIKIIKVDYVPQIIKEFKALI